MGFAKDHFEIHAKSRETMDNGDVFVLYEIVPKTHLNYSTPKKEELEAILDALDSAWPSRCSKHDLDAQQIHPYEGHVAANERYLKKWKNQLEQESLEERRMALEERRQLSNEVNLLLTNKAITPKEAKQVLLNNDDTITIV